MLKEIDFGSYLGYFDCITDTNNFPVINIVGYTARLGAYEITEMFSPMTVYTVQCSIGYTKR